MRLFIFLLLTLCYVPVSLVWAGTRNYDDTKLLQSSGGAIISGVSSALSRADVVLCKSMIYPKHLKGDYGETIVGKFYLEQHLIESGNWKSVTARFGRQGIDQIYIKFDSLGRPRDIMVGEVKYGNSRIGLTKDGLQGGQKWVQPRLVALGKRYLSASSSNEISVQTRPSKLNVRHQIEIDLGNGEKGIFWREAGRNPWKYEGRKEDLALAQKKAKSTGQFIKKAGENIIRVKLRIFEVKTADKEFLTITVKDAIHLDNGVSQAKIKGQTIRIRLRGEGGKLSNNALSDEIAKQIKRKLPHLSDGECRDYAKTIVAQETNIEDIKIAKYAYEKAIAYSSLKAGTVGAIFAIAFEGISQAISGRLDYQKLLGTGALGFSSVGIGSAIGQISTSSIIRSKVAHAVLIKVASSLGVSTQFLSNTIGASTGGGVTSILFAYGGYLMGYYDAYTANKIAASGLIGAGGGAFAATGTMSLVSAYATAGTGTAISSLSGAAMTNSVLAWLGGGTVASGGGGVVWGTMVLGGVVTVATMAVSATAGYCLSLYDEREGKILLKKKLEFFQRKECFLPQAKRLYSFAR